MARDERLGCLLQHPIQADGACAVRDDVQVLGRQTEAAGHDAGEGLRRGESHNPAA